MESIGSKEGIIKGEVERALAEIDLGVEVEGYFREQIKEKVEGLIKAEQGIFLGRGHYERSEGEDPNYRNGSTGRWVKNCFGEQRIEVPRDRKGLFESRILNWFKAGKKKVREFLGVAFYEGVSTRRCKKLLKKLLGYEISASEVSKAAAQIEDEAREWWRRRLSGEYRFLYIDGVNLPVKRFTVSKESCLVVLGVDLEGKTKVLACSLGDKESAKSWKEVFRELIWRGLDKEKVGLGVMDGLPGLEEAFREYFPKAQTQRCVVHKLRNVAVKLPRKEQKQVLSELKAVYYAPSRARSLELFREWKNRYERVFGEAVRCAEKDLEATLAFQSFPVSTWKSLRTTNLIERFFKELKRRVRPMGVVASENLCLRLVYQIARSLEDHWSKTIRYGFKKVSIKDLPLAA